MLLEPEAREASPTLPSAALLSPSASGRQGNCWAAAARGCAPSESSPHLPSSYITMWRVVIGATRLTQLGPEAQVRNIKRLLLHQGYSNITQRNDIALLELDQPVQCNAYVQLACVPDASLRVSQLKNCYISGWGATTERCEYRGSTRVPSASLARSGPLLGLPDSRGQSPSQAVGTYAS